MTAVAPPNPGSLVFTDPRENREHRFPSVLSDAPDRLLTVVVPAYNEQERLPAMMDDLLKYMHTRQIDDSLFTYEVVIVDDGSKDRTAAVAMEYVERYGADVVRLCSMVVNRGKGGAVRQGSLVARGRLILMADADGATRISDLSKLEDAIRPSLESGLAAIAVGSRAHMVETDAVAERKWYRNLLMHIFNAIVHIFCVSGIKDTQCGFKLFTREAVQAIMPSQHVERWAFDVELLYLAQRLKMPISEVAVNWQEIEGSKVTVAGVAAMGRDIVNIWLLYTLSIWTMETQNA